MNALLLQLADGRLPAGGHAHSGGLEQAAAQGFVRDEQTLRLFLLARLRSTGKTNAAIAAAAARAAWHEYALYALDDAADARTPSPAARSASRAQGRALIRVAVSMALLPPVPRAPHHAVALGAVAGCAGATPDEAALIAAQAAVTGPAAAAVRLLGLDPLAVQGLLAAMSAEIDVTADAAAVVGALTAATTPFADLLAEHHAKREMCLFAS